MSEFLKQHKLYLTPLSPIHMGSGEDFEPTNYVVSDGFLQLFDPSNIQLPNILRDQLLNIAKRKLPDVGTKSGNQECVRYILDLHSWFKRNNSIIAQSAYHFVPVSNSVEKEYEKAFGNARNEGEAVNQFIIERTEYNPITGQVYIPGSAFKGTVRTTWLEYLSTEHKAKIDNLRSGKEREQNYEKTLLNSFDKDPMRLFKPADFIPNGENAYTSIQYSINKYKKQPEDATKNPQGLKVRRESILEGQYRAFVSNSVIQQVKDKINIAQLTMRELAKKNNEYYLKRFHKECQLMSDRGFLNESWFKSTQTLLHKLDIPLQMGDVMLVRLGKNTGAESKTDDQYASIKIMQARGTPAKHEKTTKTLWLASTIDKAQSNMLPFGWAIVEIDPENDSQPLQNWCVANNVSSDIAKKFEALRQIQIEMVEKAEAEVKARAAEEEAKAQAEQKAAEALANMSDAERLVYDIKECFSQPNLQAGNEAGQAALNFLTEKLTEAQKFSAVDQKQVVEALPFSTFKGVISKKREKEFKALLNQLRGEG